MPTSYNGWVNRETWLANLHLGEFMYNEACEALRCFQYQSLEHYVENLALGYKDAYNEMMMPADANPLIIDLLRNNDIFWLQLATHHGTEAVQDFMHVFPDNETRGSDTRCTKCEQYHSNK